MHVSKIQFDFRRKKCSSKIFKEECIVCDQINKTRAYYLRTARSRYVKWLKKLRETIKRKIIVYCHREEDAIEKETQKKQ